jgi:hypothetical protein
MTHTSGENDPAAPARPEFSVARIASTPDVPNAVAHLLVTDGVPRDKWGHLNVYDLVDPARFVPGLGRSGFVVFGESGIAARLCLDVATGAVVQVDSIEAETPTLSSVNSTLDLFRACTEAFIGRFRFYDLDDSDSNSDEADAVGAELRQLFESIDPAAGAGFWFDLTYDVGMGDWATQMVLGEFND